MNNSYSPNFAEDFLPDGQHAIKTSNLTNFHAFCSLLTETGSGSLRMGVVTGAPGTGKTTAIQSYLDAQRINAHTGLPSALRIKVKPKSTPKALATDVVSVVKDRARGRTSYELADEAADAIIRNDVKLLFVDEADRLTADTFDLLRYIHDKSGCPIAVVGLPAILRVIDAQDQYGSRTALRMHFEPLEPDEILATVMPELVFPFWEFDPGNVQDREMGERLWRAITPSLRKLRNALEISSRLAELRQQRIDAELIGEALSWTTTDSDVRRYNEKKAPAPPKTEEEISERRKAARKGKKTK